MSTPSIRAHAPKTKQGMPFVGKQKPPAAAIHRRGHKAWSRGWNMAKQGDHVGAVSCFEQAIACDPDDSLYWLNLSNSERRLGRVEASIEHGLKAFELDPASLTACHSVAEALRLANRMDEMLAVLDRLDASVERDAKWHLLHGSALEHKRDLSGAVQSFLAAMVAASEDPDTRIRAAQQLGHCFLRLRRHDDAAICYRMLVDANPLAIGSAMYAAHSSSWACDWPNLDMDLTRLQDAIARVRELAPGTATESLAPFCLLTLTDDPELLKWSAMLALRNKDNHAVAPHVRQPVPRHDGKIRIGMLSADFAHHATAMLMTEAMECLDRNRFELYLYSSGDPDQSALRRRIEATATVLHEVKDWSSKKIAEQIGADGIGLMFDLKGYTMGSRVDALAGRPAPIQIAWLGYPGTSGAAFLDYIVGDPVVTPLAAQPHFTEYIAQMPACYQPNDSTRSRPAASDRPACGLPAQGFVFASFNQSYKIVPAMFEAWCHIVGQVPDSVLWLLVPEPATQDRLRQAAQGFGLDPNRIRFAPFLSSDKHRARLPNADLFLDCFPCSGHTTASDALWAGVPVLTLIGQSFASRVAASLLSTLGTPELICSDLDQYIAEAVRYARDPKALAAVRARVDIGRDRSPLFDGKRFAHDLEALLMRMVARHDAGLPPAPLAALPHEGQQA